jgi:hypothetical protein
VFVVGENPTEELYLIPSAYKPGETVSVTGAILACTRSDFVAEVTVEKT